MSSLTTKILEKKWDNNCKPTPPLTQQQSTDNKLGLMLSEGRGGEGRGGLGSQLLRY